MFLPVYIFLIFLCAQILILDAESKMSFASGLASLTAQYTDSEGEDEQKDSDSPSPEKVQEIKRSPHPTKMVSISFYIVEVNQVFLTR